MRFRTGLVFGMGIGYVLGARAGYERYQQIQQRWRSLRRSGPAQRLGSEVRDLADRVGSLLEQKASRGMDRVTEQVSSNSPSDDLGTMR